MKLTHLYLKECQEISVFIFFPVRIPLTSQEAPQEICHLAQLNFSDFLICISVFCTSSLTFSGTQTLSEWVLLTKMLYNIDPKTWQKEKEYNKKLI